MPQDILVWIPLNLFTFLCVHFAFAVIGLVVHLMNEKHLTISNVIFALFFGVFYFLNLVWDGQAVIIDLRPHSKLQKLESEINRHINEKAALMLELEKYKPSQTKVEINS